MKRILIIFIFLAAAWPAWAQQSGFNRLYGEYSVREGFTSMELGEKMMKMMGRRVGESDRGLSELLDGIRSIRILAVQGAGAEEVDRFMAKLLSVTEDGKFELVMSNTEDGQTTKFYFIAGGRSACSEFLMITYGPKERMALDIYGIFDVKDISRLSTLRGR